MHDTPTLSNTNPGKLSGNSLYKFTIIASHGRSMDSQLQRARLVSDGTRLAVYQLKDVYGRSLAYPINDQAETIQGLTGFKTLRRQDIAKIEELGFNVVTIHGERIKPSMIN
tara:strand:- start:86 stop:421 length:336 start_codon:yes stop_codon:yes gene_type:complete